MTLSLPVQPQQFTNSYATRWSIKPRQPVARNRVVASAGLSAYNLFTYDLITPYAGGNDGANVTSNPTELAQRMVGWGMIVHLAIKTTLAATINIYADLIDGTQTELDFSPIALPVSTKIQLFHLPIIPAYFIYGKITTAASAVTAIWHASLTDY